MKNIIYIFVYRFANVGMKPEVPFYNIFMYLYNKNILEYAEIVVTVPKFAIHYNEGHSNTVNEMIVMCKKRRFFSTIVLIQNRATLLHIVLHLALSQNTVRCLFLEKNHVVFYHNFC